MKRRHRLVKAAGLHTRGFLERVRRRVDRASMDSMGAESTLEPRVHVTGSPASLPSYEATIAALDVTIEDVVLVCTVGAVDMANEFAAMLPGATIHVLTESGIPPQRRGELAPNVRRNRCRTGGQRRYRLARLPQPQLIVECGRGNASQRVRRLQSLFFFLEAGGAYVVGAAPGFADDFNREEIETLLHQSMHTELTSKQARLKSTEFAAAIGQISGSATQVVVEKRLDHRLKIVESRATSLLNSRYGDAWGGRVSERPSKVCEPRGHTEMHGVSRDARSSDRVLLLNAPGTIPGLSLRRYSGVTAWRFQRLALDGYWLSDTFRHHLDRTLNHRLLVNANRAHARLRTGDDRPSREIAGPCFYFDTAYPGHFGHVLSEVISRYWGWQEAVRREPSLTPLLSLADGQKEMPEFQRRIFEALKIDVERAEYISGSEAVRVNSLYAATPAMVNPRYADPALADVWASIATSLHEDGDTPKRLFVARRVRHIRSCTNTGEVEQFFRGLGFSLFYPEDHSFAHQVTAFANADVIAGFAGSGMFSMMFAPDTTVILIRPDSYTAANESLIASVVGDHLHCFWAESDVLHPPRGWTWAAYQSNFHFDVGRFSAEIRDIVENA